MLDYKSSKWKNRCLASFTNAIPVRGGIFCPWMKAANKISESKTPIAPLLFRHLHHQVCARKKNMDVSDLSWEYEEQ